MAAKPGYRAPTGRKTLFGIVGAAAAALLLTSVPMEESGRRVEATVSTTTGAATVRHVSGPQYLRAYLDAVRVPTACDGITKGVRMGQTYTEAQCGQLLEQELIVHAEGVIACVPALVGRGQQIAAAVSLAYNVGVRAFCGSTAARMFRAGRWADGCRAFAMWNKAGGKVLAGLVARRRREQAMCLTGLPA